MALKIRTHLFSYLALLGAFISPHASARVTDIGLKCNDIPKALTVDHVWGGTRVAFDALENKGFIYIAYYDADRWLSVAQVDKCSGTEKKIRIPSRFEGWDAHNSITLAFDNLNRLHVSGNMHVSPLVYARMDTSDQLSGLDRVRSMVGQDETQATYPYFFRFGDGSLGFAYRSGHSGDGVELINRLVGSGWVRWTSTPVFAPASEKNHVNAYHTEFLLGPDGFFHVAWVWREDYAVETNFNVNYAKSKDLRTWENSSGKILPLPITPKSAEVVDFIPERSGLLNNIRLGFDGAGRPVISYLKFDASGATQLFHARRDEAGWKSVAATRWTYRWDPRGGGTIVGEIGFSGVRQHDGQLIEQVHQPEINSKTFVYDTDSLKLMEVRDPVHDDVTSTIAHRQGPAGMVLSLRNVRTGGTAAGPSDSHVISWFSRPADNRDKSRKCTTAAEPCNYVSELILSTIRSSSESRN
ncbi:BNR repeat-containing protein [Paraburkholderia sp. ZP32-5]|uniref:BNR repeat-containing protein n=1 Tax=Paraburkholderia sp. ZP32-5 TaxID=2883245 RepID=UPI001F3393BC|nr:BNR repeat-containing protein [Paraburkholderia sp. ZP32-5]